jgi:hypothetical protein
MGINKALTNIGSKIINLEVSIVLLIGILILGIGYANQKDEYGNENKYGYIGMGIGITIIILSIFGLIATRGIERLIGVSSLIGAFRK